MSDIVSLKDRGKYQGFVEGGIAIANGAGPILGAVFAQKASWRYAHRSFRTCQAEHYSSPRWCFWINLPLSGLAIILLVVYLPSKPTSGNLTAKLKAVDYVGALSSLAATVLLLLGLTWGGIEYPWVSAQGTL